MSLCSQIHDRQPLYTLVERSLPCDTRHTLTAGMAPRRHLRYDSWSHYRRNRVSIGLPQLVFHMGIRAFLWWYSCPVGNDCRHLVSAMLVHARSGKSFNPMLELLDLSTPLKLEPLEDLEPQSSAGHIRSRSYFQSGPVRKCLCSADRSVS